MGWSFKLHGGVAAGLGAVLLVLAGLTWLPGNLPVTGSGSGWAMAVIVVLLFPIFIAALGRLLLRRADRRSVWLACRCLPGKVQVVLGALFVSGVLLLSASGVGEGKIQSAETKDGRYFVFATIPDERGTIEVSRSQYLTVLESDQRSMFAIPGVLFVGAAYGVLAAGELRRAELGPSS